MEDKPAPGEESEKKSFSWWDVQDEMASLPVKTATPGQLNKFFAPPSKHSSDETVSDHATKAAKGVFKSVGKAVSAAVGGDDSSSGPQVTVVALKLLDLVKMHDDFSHKNHGRGGHIQQPVSAPKPHSASKPQSHARPQSTPAQLHQNAPAQQQRQQPAAAPARQQPAASQNLMDFGAPSSQPMHHVSSAPSSLNRTTSNPNESRTEKLKREYQEKKQSSSRIWDPVDERWVEVDPKTANSASGSAPINSNGASKNVGISLDATAAIGKPAHVAAAVEKRVNDMKNSQAKALDEVRQREAKKKADEAEEEQVRQRLTPKIKTWSEEHGKKKQLRALLASLQVILWPAAVAKWKVVTIGDLLDDKKVKLCFHKASRIVHPDKTHDLCAEERFLAKRIFDALSQAKTEFDNGK